MGQCFACLRLVLACEQQLVSCFLSPDQLLQQLKRLICDLCRLYNLPQHPDVEMLDQPLPTGPITQDRKVAAGCEKASHVQSELGVLQLTVCVVSPQHGLSDEVTSEEEEEEEMGEVFVHLLHRCRCLHPVCNHRPSTGSRTLTWTKTWTIMT